MAEVTPQDKRGQADVKIKHAKETKATVCLCVDKNPYTINT